MSGTKEERGLFHRVIGVPLMAVVDFRPPPLDLMAAERRRRQREHDDLCRRKREIEARARATAADLETYQATLHEIQLMRVLLFGDRLLTESFPKADMDPFNGIEPSDKGLDGRMQFHEMREKLNTEEREVRTDMREAREAEASLQQERRRVQADICKTEALLRSIPPPKTG